MVKVSVIIPVYNSEKYLNKCLDSLVNQTLRDIEIIIVNDGSTDNSEKIIKCYLNDSRINYFAQENQGQAAARNRALKLAKGEYISFVDSDDYVDLNMLEELYNAANSMYDIVVCDFYQTYLNGENIDEYCSILKKSEGVISCKDYLFAGAGPWNKIYKRNFLMDNNFNFPEGIVYEDYASIPTLAIYNPKIYYVKMAFLHYVQSEESTMRATAYRKKFENIFDASYYLYDHMKNHGFDEELTYLLAYHFLYLGSLNFYRFGKYEKIDLISNFMKDHFPKWYNNKYVRELKLKERILMRLFYWKRYEVIRFVQKIKR